MKMRKLLPVLAMVGVLLAGCQGQAGNGRFNPEESSIYVTADGGIYSALVFTSEVENENYDETELRAEAEDSVKEYNLAHGSTEASENAADGAKLPVALTSCELEGQTGKLIFEYSDGTHLIEFAQEQHDASNSVQSIDVTTVAAGLLEGAIADRSFLTVKGEAARHEEVSEKSDAALAIIDGAAVVYTDKPVLYVSDGAEILDKYHVRLPEGMNYIVFQ